MTVYEWPDGVEQRFHGSRLTFDDGVTVSRYEGGRVVTWRGDGGGPLWKRKAKLKLTASEAATFRAWVSGRLGGTLYAFHCRKLDIGLRTVAWRLTQVPEFPESGRMFDIQLEMEEVRV